MASDELKEMRKNLTKEAVRDHQLATTGGTVTDLFTCGKCKGKCCTYTQVRATSREPFHVNVSNPWCCCRNHIHPTVVFSLTCMWHKHTQILHVIICIIN